MLKFFLVTLFLTTQVFALRLQKKSKSLDPNDSTGKRFAYVTLFKLPKELQKKVLKESQSAALKDMGTMEQTMESESGDGEALLPGGHKSYGPDIIFRMDDQLRKVEAKYPLVVLTDDPRLINSKELKDHPNLKILRIGDDVESSESFYRGQVEKMPERVRHTIQKLSFFNMTQYDKIVSFDLDVAVQGNLDHLFTDYDTEGGETVYGAMDSWKCNTKPKRGNLNDPQNMYFQSSIMVLTPQEGIIKKMKKVPFLNKWGDQQIIQEFFKTQKKPAQLLPSGLISMPNCDDAKKAAIIHYR